MSDAAATDFFGDDPFNLDKLDPELRSYVETGTPEDGIIGGSMLRHPLVYQVPGPVMWKHANEMLAYKQKRLADCLHEDDHEGALWLYERPHRMSVLFVWASSLKKEVLQELLASVWIDCEYPKQYGYSKLVRLFKRAG